MTPFPLRDKTNKHIAILGGGMLASQLHKQLNVSQLEAECYNHSTLPWSQLHTVVCAYDIEAHTHALAMSKACQQHNVQLLCISMRAPEFAISPIFSSAGQPCYQCWHQRRLSLSHNANAEQAFSTQITKQHTSNTLKETVPGGLFQCQAAQVSAYAVQVVMKSLSSNSETISSTTTKNTSYRYITGNMLTANVSSHPLYPLGTCPQCGQYHITSEDYLNELRESLTPSPATGAGHE
ncbi:hypothetical protein M9194_04890 [Vibrio sp. S4M6]|uniref:hypothetical protein n=1 Tax=Vibrio sinus TaxID=2946865 RepID=UPI002029F223|nr:hypothetical protein [Vibrio sinus]MCL9780774.1 hypothetical protein [Vibrio sinus]